jgi:hypothetical protein
MAFGLLMTAFGIGAACALLYYCAVFALPVFVGLSAAFWAMNSGAGAGTIVIGFAAGVLVFVIGQIAFIGTRSPIVRWTVALLFAVPTAMAGYGMALRLSEFAIPSVAWRHIFALIASVIIGGTAITQQGNACDEFPRASS